MYALSQVAHRITIKNIVLGSTIILHDADGLKPHQDVPNVPPLIWRKQ
jgi:hypothetical protein